MNDTIEVIIDGLLAQKDKLEAVILELNSLETEYAKDRAERGLIAVHINKTLFMHN